MTLDPAMDPGDTRPDATGPGIPDPVTVRQAQSGLRSARVPAAMLPSAPPATG